MALRLDSPVFNTLQATLHPAFIEALAKLEGIVQRKRKVDPVVLVWTLFLGFGAGAGRTLTALRRTYEQAAGHTLSASSFQQRLTPELGKLIRRLVGHLLEHQRAPSSPTIAAALERFEALLAIDTTVVRLHTMLRKHFPATHDKQAACKLHVVHNVVSAAPTRVVLSGATTSDQRPWSRIGGWVAGCLLILDLGYYNFDLFRRIEANGGYFLSRLKSNANMRIVADLGAPARGRAHPLVGRRIQEVLPYLRRAVFDVEVEVSIELRAYRGHSKRVSRRFRVVGIRNEQTGRHHLYMTNVREIEAAQFGELYALRWQVELLFKGLRSQGRLAELPSRKQHIVEMLLWASIGALILSRGLLELLRHCFPDRAFPSLRFDAVFATFALTLLAGVTAERRTGALDPWEHMAREALDPNRDRPSSFDMVWEDGAHAFSLASARISA
jgi:putative transposase